MNKSPGGDLFSSLLVKGGFTEMSLPSYKIHSYDTVTCSSGPDFSSWIPSRDSAHSCFMEEMFDDFLLLE